jgi:hypothetical protein
MSSTNDDGTASGTEERPDSVPLVSVIVRTTGRPELAEALASIAAQSYRNIEVVVVNAGGTPLAGVGERCDPFPVRE